MALIHTYTHRKNKTKEPLSKDAESSSMFLLSMMHNAPQSPAQLKLLFVITAALSSAAQTTKQSRTLHLLWNTRKAATSIKMQRVLVVCWLTWHMQRRVSVGRHPTVIDWATMLVSKHANFLHVAFKLEVFGRKFCLRFSVLVVDLWDFGHSSCFQDVHWFYSLTALYRHELRNAIKTYFLYRVTCDQNKGCIWHKNKAIWVICGR